MTDDLVEDKIRQTYLKRRRVHSINQFAFFIRIVFGRELIRFLKKKLYEGKKFV